MVYMVFVAVICLLAVLIVVRDIMRESIKESKAARKEAKEEREYEEAKAAEAAKAQEAAKVEEPAPVVEEPAPAPAPVVVEEPAPVAEEPVAEEPAAEEPAEEEASEADDEGNVRFSATAQQSLEEKYLELSAKEKRWFDAIAKHAANIEESRQIKTQRYEEYRLGKSRLVRLLIKRGAIHCEFTLLNNDFKNYVNQSKISFKQAATVIKVVDEASVGVVKSSIDIAHAAILEERELKKQQMLEKRRERRQQKKAEEAAAAAEK